MELFAFQTGQFDELVTDQLDEIPNEESESEIIIEDHSDDEQV
jgi:hypothetical protein